MNLEEFIENFGFKYKRVVTVDKEQKKLNHYGILKPYILGDGKIYISSFDPVYAKFHILAYKDKKSLTAYLKDEFDLERYSHISDVPTHLNPKIEKMIYSESKEETLINIIYEDYIIDEELKSIYIPTTSSFYWQLFKYCDSLDKDIDEVIESWGFTRIRKTDIYFIEPEEQNSEDFIEALSDMQNSINKEEIETTRQKRSQRLVNLLKEMYDYQCQLCGDESIIPSIQMTNGIKYVEVHHIVPLHKQDYMNDESSCILDDYENAIVVCAHHHKVLHYENGGYLDIVNKDGELYFTNNHNPIHIKKNLHLNENDQLVSQLINALKTL